MIDRSLAPCATVGRRRAARGLACLLALTAACSSTTGGTLTPDAAPDAVAPDTALDAVAPDVAPDIALDAVAPDTARDAVTPDAVAPDAPRDVGPLRCASNRDCPAGTVCEYAMGCDQTAGTCRSDLCRSLPVAPQYCGCGGRTLQEGSACLPDQPWRAMGACPDAGAPDAGGRFDEAVMLWQSPGGVVGWGPAVMVSGDGLVEFWRMRTTFTLASAPRVPPDSTQRVTPAEAEELFRLWSMVDVSMLPHRTMGFTECDPSVTVRRCATCPEERIAYTTPASLLPEMNAVWGWFDRRYPARSPRGHCAP